MIQTEFGYNPEGKLLIKANPHFMGLKLLGTTLKFIDKCNIK